MHVMESASVSTAIQGHPQYSCRVFYHQSRDFGEVYFDTSVVEDRTTLEQYDWSPGLFDISEAVYCFAEEKAWEVATA